VAEQLAGSRNASLDLVNHHKDIVLVAKLAHAAQVVVIGHNNTSLALDRLNEEASDLLAVRLESLLKRRDIVVGNGLASGRAVCADAWKVRAVVLSALRVCGHGDRSERPAVEVLLHAEHQRLVLGNALGLVSPLARNLDGRLHGFCAGVHGQHHVEAGHARDLLGELGEDIVVECSAAEGQAAGLVDKSLDELRVTMALVHSRVCRKEVKVVLSLGVPHTAALCFRENDRQWVVVVRGERCLGGHSLLRGRGMVCGCLFWWGEGGGFGIEVAVGAVAIDLNGHGSHVVDDTGERGSVWGCCLGCRRDSDTIGTDKGTYCGMGIKEARGEK